MSYSTEATKCTRKLRFVLLVPRWVGAKGGSAGGAGAGSAAGGDDCRVDISSVITDDVLTALDNSNG